MKGWDEVIEIKRRIKEGRKVSEVARELGIDRKTVRKYRDLTVEEIAVYRRQSKRRSRKVDHYKDWVGHRVKVMAEDGVINAQAIYEEHRQAREVMHEMLEQDEPDTDEVMKQADVIGEIDVRKHKHRLATMLKIRAKLTPEQRSELRAMKDEMHERHGKHHRRGGGCRGEGCPGDGPPAEDL